MPFSAGKYLKFRTGMQKRIGSLRSKTEDSMEMAVDTMMEERVDSYFRIEQGLDEIIKSLMQIEDELEQIRDLSGAMRLESRLEFVEDRWDDLDSEIRERPRRRRRSNRRRVGHRASRAAHDLPRRARSSRLSPDLRRGTTSSGRRRRNRASRCR